MARNVLILTTYSLSTVNTSFGVSETIMPAITDSSATILVTGASGFIGTWVVDNLLRGGYKVRAAVRNEAKSKHLLEMYKSYGDKLEFCVVGDIIVCRPEPETMRGLI